MSIRFKLIALFAAILIGTMVLTAWLDGRIATRSVESAIQDRAMETGQALQAKLEQRAAYDPQGVESIVSSLLRSQRGIRAIEVGIQEQMGEHVIRVSMTRNGIVPEIRDEPSIVIPQRPASAVVDDPAGRVSIATLPARIGRSHGRIAIEASLAEADQLGAAQRRAFAWITLGACIVLILAVQLLLPRLAGKPIERLA